MDTLTNALSGALLARATAPKATRPAQLPRRTRLWVGFWAAAFPDSDFVVMFIDPLVYLTTHRGLTHSVVMLPIWALGLALAFAWIYRKRYSWRAFVGVCALGVGIHILGDVITAFGTMVLAPVSNWRAAWPVTFIIDPYFTAILVGGLIASLLWRDTRRPAVIGLTVLAAYIGLQGVLHQRALGLGEEYAARLKLDGVEVHAQPQPFSPFHWMIVLSDKNSYHLSYVSLLRSKPLPEPPADTFWLRRVYASYRPAADARWTRVARYGDEPMEATLATQAWHSESFARFRHFALFPAVYRVDRDVHGVCVWFNDLRFALIGRPMPFRYGTCQDGRETMWRVFRLIDGDDGREVRDAIGSL
jgi:inner membrane protein